MPPGAHLKLAILAAALLMLMSPTVGADTEITVTQSFITKDRVDLGEFITVGYRLVWTATKESVSYAQVYINGRLCEQYFNGWYMITDTADDLAYRSYSIGSVIAGGMPRSFQMNCDTETCVFDKVIVNMYPEYERVNVGEAPPLVWYAYYAFNFEVFKGEIVFNDTGPYDTIGTRGITVDRIVDPVHGIHGFEADTVKITWDKVEVMLFSDKRRYDAGSEAKISYNAHYMSDTKPFIGTIELNDTLTKDHVGKYKYTVKSIDDHRNGVTAFTCNVVETIYDKIIVELETQKERVNVGEEAPITYRAYHAYDNLEYSGDIVFIPKLLESPGAAEVRVLRLRDMVYFIGAFEANTVHVVWDQIQVDLSVDDHRVDQGEIAEVDYTARYAYDGQPLDPGAVKLNAYTMTMDTVGDYTFEVVEVGPNPHNITSVSFNECKVVWDQVAVKVKSPTERVVMGTMSEPDVEAHYVYDQKPFQGTYRLDKEFSAAPGSEAYRVTGITDTLYGLKGFTCQEGTYYFDTVEVEHRENQLIPGMIQVTLSLRYGTDNAPIDDAGVIVNGEPCAYQGGGVYTASLTSLQPMTSLQSLIQVDGKVVEQLTVTAPMVGNIAVMVAILALVVLAVNRLRR
ncbi:MAG TPA: hypothetical protein VMW22_05420 [Candidatus Desulfaltia sp.]|nr:hypothetical protein [Candidatus Desulfaltia sp.]